MWEGRAVKGKGKGKDKGRILANEGVSFVF